MIITAAARRQTGGRLQSVWKEIMKRTDTKPDECVHKLWRNLSRNVIPQTETEQPDKHGRLWRFIFCFCIVLCCCCLVSFFFFRVVFSLSCFSFKTRPIHIGVDPLKGMRLASGEGDYWIHVFIFLNLNLQIRKKIIMLMMIVKRACCDFCESFATRWQRQRHDLHRHLTAATTWPWQPPSVPLCSLPEGRWVRSQVEGPVEYSSWLVSS